MSFRLHAQSDNWRSYLEQLAEQLAEEGEEGSETMAVENIFQELLQLENNPVNLNRVTREELQRFPLFTYEQANALSDFLERNRPVYTAFELRNVVELDYNTVQLVLPFFYAGETTPPEQSVWQRLRQGRNELQVRFDKTLDRRAGYGEFSDSILQRYPNRKYRGEDFYTSLRYSFTLADKLQLGVVGEKDAGEPFFKRDYRRGYDHFGFHLILRDVGMLKTLALGDYRLSFGQGLVLNNDFMSVKSWSVNDPARRAQEPKRHFSTAEEGFFRGAAAVLGWGPVRVTTFYSNQSFDANLSESGEITSFKRDGYHRTPLEMEKKDNSRETVTGVNINYRKGRLQLGLSGLWHGYNRTYNPTLRDYNRFYLRGSSNLNAGIDYSFRLNRLLFAGETAVSKNGAVATTNSVRYTPSGLFSLSALYRNFPISYQAMHAQTLSEGSRVENEKGVYVGVLVSPFRGFRATAYLDIFRFPWMKYQVDNPSAGIEFYLLAAYQLHAGSTLEWRIKYKLKEKNSPNRDQATRTVEPYHTGKMRVRWLHILPRGWELRTTLDLVSFEEESSPRENGFMLAQNVSYRGGGKIEGDLFVGYFDSASYSSRLFSYERNLLNTFYMPSFYGKGMRLVFSGRLQLTPRCSLSVKMGHTRYFNRDTIGTGAETINSSHRTDIYTYVRWRF